MASAPQPPVSERHGLLLATARNLLAGLRLAPAAKFQSGFWENVLLALVCVAVSLLGSYPRGTDELALYELGLTSWAAIAFVFVVFVLVVARMQSASPVPLVTMLLSTAAWYLALAYFVARAIGAVPWAVVIMILFGGGLVFSAVWRLYGKKAVGALTLTVAGTIAVLAIDWFLFEPPVLLKNVVDLGLIHPGPDTVRDLEAVYYGQREMREAELAQLLPQRPGESDLYFVGFAGGESSKIYRRDVEYVKALFDEYFGTAGRSIILRGGLQTGDLWPLPDRFNLAASIEYIGRLIDPNEDTVFVFVSEWEQERGVMEQWLDAGPRPLRALDLRLALDTSGVGWRVIVMSTCSGVRADELASTQSIVITAANARAADDACGNGTELTWFTDTFFRAGLAQGLGIVEAFDQVANQGEGRAAELLIGDAMSRRLDETELALSVLRKGP